MAEQPATAIVKRQPVAHEGDAAVPLAGFIAEMGEGVGGIGVTPDLGQGPFYLGARRVVLTDFR